MAYFFMNTYFVIILCNMIDKVNISNEEIRKLHEKGANLDPKGFNFENLAHSGRHAHDVIDE